jgi:hypothetical protein
MCGQQETSSNTLATIQWAYINCMATIRKLDLNPIKNQMQLFIQLDMTTLLIKMAT